MRPVAITVHEGFLGSTWAKIVIYGRNLLLSPSNSLL